MTQHYELMVDVLETFTSSKFTLCSYPKKTAVLVYKTRVNRINYMPIFLRVWWKKYILFYSILFSQSITQRITAKYFQRPILKGSMLWYLHRYLIHVGTEPLSSHTLGRSRKSSVPHENQLVHHDEWAAEVKERDTTGSAIKNSWIRCLLGKKRLVSSIMNGAGSSFWYLNRWYCI